MTADNQTISQRKQSQQRLKPRPF